MIVFILVFLSSYYISTDGLYEGDDCTEAISGKCIKVEQCNYALELLKQNKRPAHCGFAGNIPLVCCPTTQKSNKPPLVAAKYSIEGDKCLVSGSSPDTIVLEGKCTTEQKCNYKQEKIQVLSRLCNSPLICCPNNDQVQNLKRPGFISQRKCLEYSHKKRTIPKLFVYGGVPAEPKEFPHMVAIGYGDDIRSIKWSCGGSLISHRFVLTAAHCTSFRQFGNATYTRFGDVTPISVKITQIYVHPDYKYPLYYHDIALLKLENEVLYDTDVDGVREACLHVGKSLPTTTLRATGWGQTDFGSDSSTNLMKVDLSIINYRTCSQKFSAVSLGRKLKDGILDQFQLCAGNTGKDTCQGDSGGPLQYVESGNGDTERHYVIAGITSFGGSCGTGDGVYTRVSAYIPWIEKIVWADDIPF